MTVESAFGLTFQASITDATGSKVTFDLKESGESIPVTSANREVSNKMSILSSTNDFLFRNSFVSTAILC